MADRLVTVFGGSGFVGRHLVNMLADEGWRVRVAVRDPEGAKFLKPLGELGQIVPTPADVSRPDTVAAAVRGADAVVNLVGILSEHGKATFQAIHVDGAATIARAAKEAGARQFLHMSALGASAESAARYARSKAEGEDKVREAFPEATIFRPSVIFGPEDGFYNMFGALARTLPALFYFTQDAPAVRFSKGALPTFDFYGKGGPRFQPVYVGDVAEAMMRVLKGPSQAGKTFELGGPRVYTMREVMQQVAEVTRRDRLILPVPMWVARIQSAFLQFLPNPPLTPDQVKLLQQDNVLGGDLPGFQDLGIEPELTDAILPAYLERFRALSRQIRRLGRRGI